ncbi:hypothetical protein KC207_05625 [Phycicoccus sp. BSK3Z-2]|uniref:Uncharacterized protein n=1 Tax=Phycicoccus avicenniae TaxID=2828860 RepID=A0A941D614_9MICO|nr:hypothetical protein [Phycicoccus avicenniae]MBR7742769.1 hypothetical protein [Phycicoccus avicenniae]
MHAPRDVDAPGTGPAGDGTGSSARGHSLTDAEVSADHVSTADPAGGRAGRRAARRAEESRRLRRRRAVLVSLVLLGVVAVAGWWLVRPTSDTSAPVPALVDLVLAPLEDIGPGSPS